ncbi:WXG100 family type VII secretion target [bacterium]|nr:WXG100 family type VII secretion target [bacterium]
MFGRIFKFARSIVSGIINQIMQQVNVIQEAVTSPLRAMVNQVMGGIWRGDGAERFVEEMTNEVIPLLVGIAGVNNNYANAIKKSMDRMEQAEKQATSRAQQLFDVFGKIF